MKGLQVQASAIGNSAGTDERSHLHGVTNNEVMVPGPEADAESGKPLSAFFCRASGKKLASEEYKALVAAKTCPS